MDMKTTLRIEELAMFGLALLLWMQGGFTWWVFFVALLAPDIGMLGYVINAKIGAISYNICHHKGLAIALYYFGLVHHIPWLEGTALIIFGHASIDRVMGYGLKYFDAFQHTHLGMIGKQKS